MRARWGRVLLIVWHISNGDLVGGGPNHGETLSLVGVRRWTRHNPA